jgi:hypothetical protein
LSGAKLQKKIIGYFFLDESRDGLDKNFFWEEERDQIAMLKN